MPEDNNPTETDEQAETAALEEALESEQTEGSDPVKPPEEQTEDEDQEAETPEAETSEAETPEPESAVVANPRKLSGAAKTQHDAKVAREKRIQEAQDEAPPAAEMTEKEAAEIKRKEGLQAKLRQTAALIEKHEDTIDKLKATARDLMGELYPHTVKSDRHVDAVRGYLKSSHEERAKRGAHPARLKELLARAGKAPIDAAFHRARARGAARPTRTLARQGEAPAQDQAKGAKPGAKE